MKIIFIFACTGSPGCSGMLRDVPQCSGMFRVPEFWSGQHSFASLCSRRALPLLFQDGGKAGGKARKSRLAFYRRPEI